MTGKKITHSVPENKFGVFAQHTTNPLTDEDLAKVQDESAAEEAAEDVLLAEEDDAIGDDEDDDGDDGQYA